ncbi:hypothetical protein [Spirosoma aerophilum]
MPAHTSTKVVLRFVNERISAVPDKCRVRAGWTRRGDAERYGGAKPDS